MYLCCADGRRVFDVYFGSSFNEAVLNFYPESSTESTGCFSVDVDVSSPAVRLLVATLDMSETSDEINLRHDKDNSRLQVVSRSGRASFTITRGRHYIAFVAQKLKVTRTSERIRLRYIRFRDLPCSFECK